MERVSGVVLARDRSMSGWAVLRDAVAQLVGRGIITGAGALLVLVIRAAGRTRGVCEGWVCTAMSRRDAVILYGPVAVVILADVVVSRFVSWSSIVAAVLVFVVFAGTGLMLSARAARW
jgi:hypothetical protein